MKEYEIEINGYVFNVSKQSEDSGYWITFPDETKGFSESFIGCKSMAKRWTEGIIQTFSL